MDSGRPLIEARSTLEFFRGLHNASLLSLSNQLDFCSNIGQALWIEGFPLGIGLFVIKISISIFVTKLGCSGLEA